MKALVTFALLAFFAITGEATEVLSHTKPEVIDDLSILDPGKVVSAAYLFDSVVTNGGNACRGKYIPRNRGFVEKGQLPITTAGDGGPSSIGSELMDSVCRHATVPIRWEQSVTTNGVNAWVSLAP